MNRSSSKRVARFGCMENRFSLIEGHRATMLTFQEHFLSFSFRKTFTLIIITSFVSALNLAFNLHVPLQLAAKCGKNSSLWCTIL